MRRIVSTQTIPDRKLRKLIGAGREDILMLDDDNALVMVPVTDGVKTGKRSELGPKTLARRLGVKLAGASLDWDNNGRLSITRVSDDRTGYQS